MSIAKFQIKRDWLDMTGNSGHKYRDGLKRGSSNTAVFCNLYRKEFSVEKSDLAQGDIHVSGSKHKSKAIKMQKQTKIDEKCVVDKLDR